MTDPLADATWHVYAVAPGSVATPTELTGRGWSARVPGTAAAAVHDARGPAALEDLDIDGSDWWWRTTVSVGTDDLPGGRAQLCLNGVATAWTVFWDGVAVGSGNSMWRAARIDLSVTPGEHEIALLCPSLRTLPTPARPRARWRSAHVADQSLRWHRTSLYGRSTWGHAPAVVGPFRPVRLEPPRHTEVTRVHTRLADDGTGFVEVELVTAAPTELDLVVDGEVRASAVIEGTGRLAAVVPEARLWWPHTHGDPAHSRLQVRERATRRVVLDRTVGFRTIEADRSDGGFRLVVNGIPIVARGVCWTTADPLRPLATAAVRRARLTAFARLGVNLVRVVGGSTWADEAFARDCTELGILLWQDAMLSSLAPPEDPAWTAEVADEVRENLTPLQGMPCVAVVSGGNETLVQPVLLGLDASRRDVPVVTEVIPAVVADVLPGVPYVPSTPSGGRLPHVPDEGLSHYYGVGPYLRPLVDARLARVRFAAESLCLTVPPERTLVESAFGRSPRLGDPDWLATVPRERNVDWDFQDVTVHYAREFFGEDPAAPDTDPRRAHDLLRAAAAHLVEQTLLEWRRPGSTCAGALVHTGMDLQLGGDWGLTDTRGGLKATAWAAGRAWSPVAALVIDEGLNGVALHVVNDRPEPLDAELAVEVTLLGSGAVALEATIPVSVGPHASSTLWLDAVLGGFRDVAHVYPFGPPAYDVLVARLSGPALPAPAESVHLLGGPARPVVPDVGLRARAVHTGDGWVVEVSAERTATFVCLEPAGPWEPADNWFHLPAAHHRRIALFGVGDGVPTGTVRALNASAEVAIDPVEGG